MTKICTRFLMAPVCLLLLYMLPISGAMAAPKIVVAWRRSSDTTDKTASNHPGNHEANVTTLSSPGTGGMYSNHCL